MILQRPCVFVDLETTGTNASSEAITEIGLRFCEVDGSCRDWQQLVNPGRAIPGFIQRLTGISDELVADAPAFSDIAADLLASLDGYVLVAHNARFDYSFLKHAFRCCDMEFRPALLCTVKLSRALYPEYRRHSLDAICERMAYQREHAHRALDDVKATHAFVMRAIAERGPDKVNEAASAQLQRPSLPAHLSQEEVERIPNSPGVYRFYGDNNALLYVGKSVRMRERVMSHFGADIHANREMRIAREVRSVDWSVTAGELGALLKENLEIKMHSPVYNRRQRRHRNLWCFELYRERDAETEGDDNDVLRARLTTRPLQARSERMPGRQSGQYVLHGLFTSKGAATKWLASAVVQHRLCKKILGLERGAGGCFNYQLKRCDGACVGEESMARHNARVAEAFAGNHLQDWPFNGPAVIVENAEDWRDAECMTHDIHVVDHWVYLGTVHDSADVASLLSGANAAAFDRETYRILCKYIHLAIPVEQLLPGSTSQAARTAGTGTVAI